ncbi:MAG: SIMPL domain-containing protein [Pseudomonadota bacterium]
MSPSMIARAVLTIASGVLMFSVLSPISRAAEVDPSGYLSRLMGNRISITGQCTVTVKPDVASITVGLDGEGDTPDEARRAMDDLRGKIRALVSGHRGQVKEQEMIRMMRSGDPLPVSVVPPGMPVMPSAPATGKTFVFSQRLDLEFPLSADVDAILLGLNKAGVKRIGRLAMMAGYYGRQLPPQPVVFYGFREPEKMAERAHQQCRLQAVEKWCQTQAPADRQGECVGELKRVLDRLTTQNMSLRSVATTAGYPGAGMFYLNYPFQSAMIQQLTLLGREPVELTGTIYLRYAGPSW